MRVVSVTKSYPSPGAPVAGTFIRSRLAAMGENGEVRVLHAVPFTRALPPDEPSSRPSVARTRYHYFPGILKGSDHRFLARSLRPVLDRWHRLAPFDVIAAEIGYPEGAAAVTLGPRYGVPVAVTLRGTERDFLGRGARGRAMADGLRRADLVLAVSRGLADVARECGVRPDRIRVIRNGVDANRFRPGDRVAARRRLGLDAGARWLLSVGLLIERKSHDQAISALAALCGGQPDLRLAIVGGGPLERRLRRHAARLGVGDRVHFAGLVPPDEVPEWYRAADLFVLASRREGLANVLLQALASGVPFVATDAGGAEELVGGPEVGTLTPVGEPARLAEAIRWALARTWDPAVLRRRAVGDSWERSGALVIAAFREMLAQD